MVLLCTTCTFQHQSVADRGAEGITRDHAEFLHAEDRTGCEEAVMALRLGAKHSAVRYLRDFTCG